MRGTSKEGGAGSPRWIRLTTSQSVSRAPQAPPAACLVGQTADAPAWPHLRGAVASVKGADLGPRLPKHRVVGGNGEVAHHVQDVAAAHRVAAGRGPGNASGKVS